MLSTFKGSSIRESQHSSSPSAPPYDAPFSRLMSILMQRNRSARAHDVVAGNLCIKCKTTLLDLINGDFSQPQWLTVKFKPSPSMRVNRHHETFGDLQSSTSECELCYKMYSYVVEQSLGLVLPIWLKWGQRHHPAGLIFIPPGFNQSDIRAQLTKVKIRPLILACDRTAKAKSIHRLRPWENTGDSRSTNGIPLGRRLGAEACTGESLDIVRGWIAECDQKHPQCKSYKAGRLPRRVIDVGSSDRDPSLYLSAREVEPYITISHCWGGTISLILEGRNIQSLQEGIPLATLPKTFQDAIVVARRLSVRYLWIDALCIIQDDKLDWLTEVTAMSEIYEGALLNICALASPNSETGFLFPRTDGSVHFTTQDAKGDEQRLFCKLKKTNLDQKWDADGILQQRAWTLQERVLSRSNLCFPAPANGRGMMWECRSRRLLETTDRVWLSESRLKGIGHRPFQARIKETKQLFPPANRSESPIIQWYRLVIEYSHRQLTFPKDKLLAITGLANSLANEIKGEFVDGLWSNDMHRGLLWKLSDYSDWKSGDNEIDRAPSWSWANYDGSISFLHAHRIMTPLQRSQDLNTGIELQITRMVAPKSDSLQGQTRWSFVAKGIIKPVLLRELPSQDSADKTHIFPVITGENRDYMAEFSRSSMEDRCWIDKPEVLPMSCYMLYICTIRKTRYVLFLTKAGEIEEQQEMLNGYRRIGIGYGDAGYMQESTIKAMEWETFVFI